MKLNVRPRSLSLALAAGLTLLAGQAFAQVAAPPPDTSAAPAAEETPAPKKHVKPKKAGMPIVAVVVRNLRGVGLIELDAALSSQGQIKKIAGPLAPGKTMIAHLAHDKACAFDLHGTYDDGSTTDAVGVNLCSDKKINLVE